MTQKPVKDYAWYLRRRAQILATMKGGSSVGDALTGVTIRLGGVKTTRSS